MRSFAIVTTCNADGYELYGRDMVSSVDRYFPRDIPVYLYAEGFHPKIASDRVFVRDLLVSCPELVDFKRRHRDNPAAHGLLGSPRLRVIVQWHKLRLKIRRIDWGLGYRWDAIRFSHKVFALDHAARSCGTDVLFWMDADIRLFADVSRAFLNELMPDQCIVSCLRRPKFSECSFVGLNLRHSGIWSFLNMFVNHYTTDAIFGEREHHDSFLFDIIRRRHEKLGHASYDIAEGIGKYCHHVFINSKLGICMDHMKGTRKTHGGSKSKDLISDREEAYWKPI